jgi:hypothetical protein
MKTFILFASMAIATGLVLTNMYTSIVDVPAWGRSIPTSIDTARQYYSASNPGDFFRIFSPINQLLGLICIIVFWKNGKQIRKFLIAAFLLYVIGEGMTFMYFYPRNEILFASKADVQQLQTTLNEWRQMNWVRTLVIAAGFICSASALHYSYLTARKTKQAYSSYPAEPAVA